MTRPDDIRELCLALDGKLVALHCALDPITDIVEVSLYTDDGHGNGDLIAALSVDDLIAGARARFIALGYDAHATA